MCVYTYIFAVSKVLLSTTLCVCSLAVAVLAATLTIILHSILLVWARKTSSYIHNPL